MWPVQAFFRMIGNAQTRKNSFPSCLGVHLDKKYTTSVLVTFFSCHKSVSLPHGGISYWTCVVTHKCMDCHRYMSRLC